MFTGLIQDMAEVKKVWEKSQDGFKFQVSRPKDWTNLKTGESIACDGVCLTLTEFSDDFLEFFVGLETLDKTTFNTLLPDQILNMERSLALGDRLGGHVVSGHVDGVAKVLEARREGGCLHLGLKLPKGLFRYVVPKGSLSLNGVSLTINKVDRETDIVEIFLIPETMVRTNLSRVQVGDLLNIETDQFVKIIAHQMGSYLEHNQ